jgi:membrane-bound inhibitor of C-type lysozyme
LGDTTARDVQGLAGRLARAAGGGSMMRCWIVALAFVIATPAPVASAETIGERPFVIVYRCDGGRFLAVGYPAFRDARTAPIRLSWDGRTRLLAPARAASGARYVSRADNLQWWSKGNGGFLNRLSDDSPLLAGCIGQTPLT